MEFTIKDYELIEESLQYTKKAYQEYQYYPSYEFKQQQIKTVKELIEKIRIFKKQSKENQ